MNIRGKAIVIFKDNDKYLFTVCIEQTTNRIFYIPVGGGIEFGEYAVDTARREVQEEIGQEIGNMQLLDINENIFSFNGVEEHEIVFIYLAVFKNSDAYLQPLTGGFNVKGEQIRLVWASIADISETDICLYPPSLLNVLKKIDTKLS